MQVATNARPATKAALILLGRDESGKPHASWFNDDIAPDAAKAAGEMGMATLPTDNEAVKALAARLPAGKLFASGRAFVPFVKGDLFDELVRHLPGGKLPKLKAKPKKVASDEKAGAAYPGIPKVTTKPESWDKIVVGSLVLAKEAPGEPWFEAVVLVEKSPGVFVLRWRDYDEPDVTRKREQLGLMHPSFSGK